MNPDTYYLANRRETSHAYLWWFFLGGFGAHRFYLGDKGIAVAQLILTLTVIGVIVSGPWVLVDAFLIPGRIREVNGRIWNDAYGWAGGAR